MLVVGPPDPELAARIPQGAALVGFLDPFSSEELVRVLMKHHITSFSMEAIPRTTLAQSMDALSSQATAAGYHAVLVAAVATPRIFPMLTTAAGTVPPVKALILGAGVAGLQAIATAKRLGAVVSAYDIRPEVKEQIESLGAKFVDVGLETADAEDKGGYAKQMDETFYAKQRELMLRIVAESDVVITTAAIPGKKAPVLVTAEMVAGMASGSVIVDLAAESGGNCEVTQIGEEIDYYGVTVSGPENVPAMLPIHASEMHSKNMINLFTHLYKTEDGALDFSDEITKNVCVTHAGKIINERVRDTIKLEKAGA